MAATNTRVFVHHRPGKLGLGTAYLEGFKWALERTYAYVFEMDADFSHNPDHLPEFLRRIVDADLVLGSRYRNGRVTVVNWPMRSEEHTSELQSLAYLVCRLLLEKKKNRTAT